MDAVMDLAARATGFIGVLQDICLHHSAVIIPENQPFHLLHPTPELNAFLKSPEADKVLIKKAVELVWINNRNTDERAVVKCFLARAEALLDWMWQEENSQVLRAKLEPGDAFPVPEKWRQALSGLLYGFPRKRTELARLLHYLPLQIVLASGGCRYNARQQRILQEWETPAEELNIILDPTDLETIQKCKKFKPGLAEELLENDEALLIHLQQQQVPLTFEIVFGSELKEIQISRRLRQQEELLARRNKTSHNPQPSQKETHLQPDSDPYAMGNSMQLQALAFSGGGIRSATFNLGILQGFAKAGLLSRFDYLSTVSGGGYIGSWLLAWIKRKGSVLKVSNRLNPRVSTDPLAEEVRPIRWLRMYSNYLSPNASIMSLDAWTVGMTVVRNMLINQVLILLLLFTLLLCGRLLFIAWTLFLGLSENPDLLVFLSSSVLIIAGSLAAGLGMQFYNKNRISSVIRIRKENPYISTFLLILGCSTAFVISAWLFSKSDPGPVFGTNFSSILLELWPSLAVSFTGLLIVAVMGRYDKCIPYTGIKKTSRLLLIPAASALALLAGLLLLLVGHRLILSLQHTFLSQGPLPSTAQAIGFILGFPLILEVLSVVVVTRMALLGSLFPDERREWWGRMGGAAHQIAFLWILTAGATLLGEEIVRNIGYLGSHLIAGAGGWAVLVIAAVRAAFSSKTSGQNEPGMLARLLDILARLGPYLFAFGLLIFLPILLHKILDSINPEWKNNLFMVFILAGTFFAVTLILAAIIGVNEFSMHHFYKNRLLRAYLGATRSRPERKNSSNPFTGFDINDDVPLSALTNKEGYFGPYPLINTTLNATEVSDLDRQDRKAESFVFSPLYCGFDFSRTRPFADVNLKSYDYGYRPTSQYAYPPLGPHLGSAMAISGAAANPNQGFHSSPATAFLLSAFNVRLGWWIGNPRKGAWRSANPRMGLSYIIWDLIGRSDTNDKFVCLSDGGHFDNMGLYELIRRRVSLIILGDGEQDEAFSCEGLANAIRRCRIDFGVEIDIDVSPITGRTDSFSAKSYAVGKISYPGDPPQSGTLIYLKSSLTRTGASVDVREYALKNPIFPHQSTGDQFFDETQFESYRKLGLTIAEAALADEKIMRILNPLAASAEDGSPEGIREKYQSLVELIKTNFNKLSNLVKED